jgi:hypothetical protein
MYCVYPKAFRRLKDVLKAGHFIASLSYQPFLSARRVPSWRDRLLALPLLFMAEAAWKGGMLEEAWRQRGPAVNPSGSPA